jgi:uncharacterized membrane protein HdeD (DUF308 family)
MKNIFIKRTEQVIVVMALLFVVSSVVRVILAMSMEELTESFLLSMVGCLLYIVFSEKR